MRPYLPILFLVIASAQASTWESLVEGQLTSISRINDPAELCPAGGELTASQQKIIDQFENRYAADFKSLGREFKIFLDWDVMKPSAWTQEAGDVHLNGGLLKHPKLTDDLLRLILCHEVGHHLGGHPKVDWLEWSSIEHQADYFAGTKCMRELLADDLVLVDLAGVPSKVVEDCSAQHKATHERNVCVRTILAGFAFVDLYKKDSPLSMTEKEKTVAPNTNRGLVNLTTSQCRFDNFYQSALCTADSKTRMPDDDEVEGSCHEATGLPVGARSACWFKPTKD